MLEGIGIFGGGKAITEELGIKLENVKIEDLGHAKKVSIDKDNTTIVAGAGKAGEIEGRIKQLRVQIEETSSDYDKEKLQERLAKLVGKTLLELFLFVIRACLFDLRSQEHTSQLQSHLNI